MAEVEQRMRLATAKAAKVISAVNKLGEKTISYGEAADGAVIAIVTACDAIKAAEICRPEAKRRADELRAEAESVKLPKDPDSRTVVHMLRLLEEAVRLLDGSVRIADESDGRYFVRETNALIRQIKQSLYRQGVRL